MNRYPLFTDQDMVRFRGTLLRLTAEMAKIPVLLLCGSLSLLFGLGVGLLDYELLYRVFDFIAGGETASDLSLGAEVQDEPLYDPWIMALTGLVMILGYKIASVDFPNHPVVKLVNRMSLALIWCYVLGIGLLLAAILYLDGGALLIDGGGLTLPGSEPLFDPAALIDGAFANIVNPLALAAFSLGVSGIAILNIFVVTRLLGWTMKNFGGAYAIFTRARHAISNYNVTRRSQKRHLELQQDQGDLIIKQDDDEINNKIAASFVLVKEEALFERKNFLLEHELYKTADYCPQEEVDLAAVRKLVKTLDSLSVEDVLKVLSSSTNPPLENNS